MARDHDWNRVVAAGAADRARRRAGIGGESAIAARLAIGDLLHRRPDALLERRTGRGERQIEMRQLAVEIGLELPRRLAQQRAAVARLAVAPADRDDRLVLFLDGQLPDRAWHRQRRHGIPQSENIKRTLAQLSQLVEQRLRLAQWQGTDR